MRILSFVAALVFATISVTAAPGAVSCKVENSNQIGLVNTQGICMDLHILSIPEKDRNDGKD